MAVTNYDEFTHYVTFTDGFKMPILEYVYPEYMSIADTQTLKIEPMLVLFDSLFGPYPFREEKYGHAMWGKGGGMEHQTMSSMSDFDFTLMAHELVHQWFGNKITCGSWQDIWLNEGFATYFTAVALEYLGTPTEHKTYMEVLRDRSMDEPFGSVYVDDTTEVNRIFSSYLSYRKAAMVLRMLRWEIGDSAFFEGIRNYTANQNICYEFARTADFIFEMEQASGRDLTDFFDRWIYKEGYPISQIRWNRISATEINIDMEQSSSVASVDFFPFKFEIRLKGEQGQDTIIILDWQTSIEKYTLNVGFKVISLEFDPNIWILTDAAVFEGVHLDKGEFQIYPNPVVDELSVFIRDVKIDSLQVFDMQGRLVHESAVLNKKNEDITISSSAWEPGIYYIKLYSGNEFYGMKFIKS